MENDQQMRALSIRELAKYVQNPCVHSDDRIVFRTSKYFHEFVRRTVKERNLTGEAEFFERLAMDYWGKLGWIDKPFPKEKMIMTFTDLEFENDHECNMAMRRIGNE